MSQRPDLIIRNATVADGSGAELFVADVAVIDDRIVSVGKSSGPGSVEIDANNLVLSPGFIDVHTHDDLAVLIDPAHRCKTLQGVTTVVVGNCGTGPLNDGALLGFGGQISRSWTSHAGYFSVLDADPASCNVGVLAGHGTIRTEVMGRYENRAASASELNQMSDHVAEALDAGVLGLSSGLAYEPGTYAPEEELADLATLIAEAGGLYASHIRDESDGLEEAVAEAIRVGERSGVAVQLSHHKAAGRTNWGKVRNTLAMVDAARAGGIDVALDQYPYTAGSTSLDQLIRQGALGGETVSGTRPFGVLVGSEVIIGSAPDMPEIEGRRLSDLASELGLGLRAAAEQLVSRAGDGTFAVFEIMNEDDVRSVMAHPSTMIGSDGIPIGGKPHPRLWGTFARILGPYVRDAGVLRLAEAVNRMTGAPANRFGLTDRGTITLGAFADLVLFDPATIADAGTYEDPARPPAGIHGVWVNGRRIVSGHDHTGDRPGRSCCTRPPGRRR